ncbi:hypothetical protein [Acinetobacter pittii]|uniref:hypothetical protein n=1 Tax=Acinetobacter pittii TaxID=48296 RepID=UPI0007084EB9|nr:hypothetical protein [Acinetobacter pittii]AZB96370.1 hypothetical protein DKE42_005500 [Acinetobacter pittii]KQE96919.1 hypothetical protein APB99_01275 [Acinetobacter pittii]KQE99811.1 hypothetical protein APB99_13860 [Acinetobacter pittii]KRI34889.1 hypothetical protein APB87_01295 [Acinetobacter pittii]MDR9711024.1 hypothetical protein [Acinetobacter pittii]
MTDLNKEREAFETWFTTTDVYKRISHQIQMCGSGRHQDIFTVFQRDDWREENYAQVSVMAAWLAWQEKAKAQAVPEKKIYLTCEQLYAAANFGAPNKDPELLETELTIAWFEEAHSGSGYYVYISEYPEEGAMKLESESGAEG